MKLEAIVEAIEMFVLNDIDYAANASNYLPENRKSAIEWQGYKTQLESALTTIMLGVDPINVIKNLKLKGNPERMLRLIESAVRGELNSNEWEVVDGNFRRIQREDPYADPKRWDY